jgi:hypothetical protein
MSNNNSDYLYFDILLKSFEKKYNFNKYDLEFIKYYIKNSLYPVNYPQITNIFSDIQNADIKTNYKKEIIRFLSSTKIKINHLDKTFNDAPLIFYPFLHIFLNKLFKNSIINLNKMHLFYFFIKNKDFFLKNNKKDNYDTKDNVFISKDFFKKFLIKYIIENLYSINNNNNEKNEITNKASEEIFSFINNNNYNYYQNYYYKKKLVHNFFEFIENNINYCNKIIGPLLNKNFDNKQDVKDSRRDIESIFDIVYDSLKEMKDRKIQFFPQENYNILNKKNLLFYLDQNNELEYFLFHSLNLEKIFSKFSLENIIHSISFIESKDITNKNFPLIKNLHNSLIEKIDINSRANNNFEIDINEFQINIIFLIKEILSENKLIFDEETINNINLCMRFQAYSMFFLKKLVNNSIHDYNVTIEEIYKTYKEYDFLFDIIMKYDLLNEFKKPFIFIDDNEFHNKFIFYRIIILFDNLIQKEFKIFENDNDDYNSKSIIMKFFINLLQDNEIKELIKNNEFFDLKNIFFDKFNILFEIKILQDLLFKNLNDYLYDFLEKNNKDDEIQIIINKLFKKDEMYEKKNLINDLMTYVKNFNENNSDLNEKINEITESIFFKKSYIIDLLLNYIKQKDAIFFHEIDTNLDTTLKLIKEQLNFLHSSIFNNDNNKISILLKLIKSYELLCHKESTHKKYFDLIKVFLNCIIEINCIDQIHKYNQIKISKTLKDFLYQNNFHNKDSKNLYIFEQYIILFEIFEKKNFDIFFINFLNDYDKYKDLLNDIKECGNTLEEIKEYYKNISYGDESFCNIFKSNESELYQINKKSEEIIKKIFNIFIKLYENSSELQNDFILISIEKIKNDLKKEYHC